ncbi:hypothetical protein BESB_048630 [Besnoitia besnoiti]|uniref:Uncharacterized protein n=1 Tax=Besnoitia besnoiti TaxID=94643 RepID=A0A2A9MK76_BESBE|nr:hypothetical protein BESB_048630 [Besnoitia besnoiti]PFH36671.1 hypothetical protein BESB_048630 [Besnoitia besnoiti]
MASFKLTLMVTVATLSSLDTAAALRGLEAGAGAARGPTTVLPVCSAVSLGSLHIDMITAGCTGNEARRVCSVGVSNPGGYPLCEELEAETCGSDCNCWSTCTDHACNPDSLSAGMFLPSSIAPCKSYMSWCRFLFYLQRYLCKAGTTGSESDEENMVHGSTKQANSSLAARWPTLKRTAQDSSILTPQPEHTNFVRHAWLCSSLAIPEATRKDGGF